MKPRKPIKRTTRPRRRKRGTLASLRREADRLWSLIVRRRGACEMDGTHAGPLQGAHGFSRRYYGTRWLLDNGFCLCAGHHVAMTHDPLRWDAFLRETWGALKYEDIRAHALHEYGVGVEEMEHVIAALKAQLEGKS